MGALVENPRELCCVVIVLPSQSVFGIRCLHVSEDHKDYTGEREPTKDCIKFCPIV